MEFFDESIPISHIRQYLFCPRIPWFKHVMSFEPPEQGWVTQGKRWHQSQNPRHKRRLHHDIESPRECIIDAYVKSSTLGIHGLVDEIVMNAEKCVVIEYKVDKGKPTLAQKYQLIAYSLAAEETYQRDVVAAILLKGSANKQYRISVSNTEKINLINVLASMRKVLSCQRVPFSSASEAKCAQCEYLRYCNDR
ncbi:CRISPR-associated protein Cas4 [Vibrio alfacsensis]|uniref:CRISPR-associated protein Cas4 n=1 Tax=Vibrio alfacsensis TaxID=1074311 RepID=UPI0040688129